VPAFEARVLHNRRVTPTTRSLVIDLRGRTLDFKPGQWARLGADAGALRPYSIASTPAEARSSGSLQFLIREDGGGMEIARLRRGSAIQIDAPHGRFCLPDRFAEPHALFVAGGTGIAPLRAMLYHTLDIGVRPYCTLVYSARNPEEFAFGREFRASARAGLIRLALTVTRAATSRWKGGSTRVDRILLAAVMESRETQAFVCGPEGFVTHVRAVLEELGVKRIRTEEL
jgi:ferredoxin-NADP reductase